MIKTKQLVAALMLLASACALYAKKSKEVQHAPLPAKVLTAKSVYIENNSGHADIADKTFTQLKAWGRYQIVDDKKKADLVLVLTTSTSQTDTTRAAWVNTYNSKTGAWTNGTVNTPTTENVDYTRLTVVDPGSGDIMWADQMEWSRRYSATEELVKELRGRIEEQEKAETTAKAANAPSH